MNQRIEACNSPQKQMDSFDYCWDDLIDYSSFIDDVSSTDLFWEYQSNSGKTDVSLTAATPQDKKCAEKECTRKRGCNNSCDRVGTKACRERLRREKLNGRFSELSSTLEPGRTARTDKLAIIGDAIRVLKQLKTESQEYKEANEKLLEEIKTLKAEKNDLREEKLKLKAEKERMEQQLKARTVSPAGFMQPNPAVYQAGSNKMPVFPSYGFVPMWHYLPQSSCDTSHDHELRPPAA